MSTSLGIDVLALDGTVVASATDSEAAIDLMAALYARTGLPYRIEGVGWIAALGPIVDPQSGPPAVFGLQAQIDVAHPDVFHFVALNASVDTEINFGDGQSATILADGDPSVSHAYADPGTYHVVAWSGPAFAEVYVNPGDAPVEPATVDG